jgi:hypothetical protein
MQAIKARLSWFCRYDFQILSAGSTAAILRGLKGLNAFAGVGVVLGNAAGKHSRVVFRQFH